jgi:hypothetical protein
MKKKCYLGSTTALNGNIKNNRQGETLELGNLPDFFMYYQKLHVQGEVLVMLCRNVWIKNLDMKKEKMFVWNTNKGTKQI